MECLGYTVEGDVLEPGAKVPMQCKSRNRVRKEKTKRGGSKWWGKTMGGGIGVEGIFMERST
jgi:hypothetical protein